MNTCEQVRDLLCCITRISGSLQPLLQCCSLTCVKWRLDIGADFFSEPCNSCREEASVMSTISRVPTAFMLHTDCSCFTRRAIVDEDVCVFKNYI